MSNDILRDLRGFGTVEKWVLTDPKIHASAKGLYALLCAFAGDKGHAFPGTELLRHQLGLSKNTLHKYIKQLELSGVIKVEQVRESGKFSRNTYSLLPQGFALTVSQNLGDHNLGAQKMGDQELDTNNNSLKNNSSKSNSNTNNRSSNADPVSRYSEQFENWWSIYPRKIGKGKAYKIWAKDKLDKRVDGLIEKLSQQNAMQFAFTEDKFIPHASTYLSEARYDDEIEQRGSANETNFTSNQQIDRTTARNRKLQEEWDRLQNNEERDGDVIPDLEVHGRQLRPTLDN